MAAKTNKTLAGFKPSDEEKEHFAAQLKELVKQALVDAVGETNRHISLKMQSAFNAKFTLDADGVPRTWQPDDDIREFFQEAREAGYDVLNRLSVIRVPAYGEIEAMSSAEIEAAKDKYAMEVQRAYTDAKRVQESEKNKNNIPMWLYVVLLVLGWNEAMAVLFSPTLMFLLIVGGGLAYYGLINLGEDPRFAPYVAMARQFVPFPLPEPAHAVAAAEKEPAAEKKTAEKKAEEKTAESKPVEAKKDD